MLSREGVQNERRMRIELVRGTKMETAVRMRTQKKFINKVMLEKNVKYFVQILSYYVIPPTVLRVA